MRDAPMYMELALDRTGGAALGAGTEGLVARARAGDRDAFRALVEPVLPAALGAAAAITRSPSDGADAVQDALLAAWRSLPALRDDGAFEAWFRRLVIRSAIRVASRGHHRLVAMEDAEDLPADLAALERELECRRIRAALDRLAPNDRAVLTLAYLWDLPGAQAAGILGVPEGTVRSRIHNALRRLRAAYDAEERA